MYSNFWSTSNTLVIVSPNLNTIDPKQKITHFNACIYPIHKIEIKVEEQWQQVN